jgi:hypothetical protein
VERCVAVCLGREGDEIYVDKKSKIDNKNDEIKTSFGWFSVLLNRDGGWWE